MNEYMSLVNILSVLRLRFIVNWVDLVCLKNIYEAALCQELELRGLNVQRQYAVEVDIQRV